MIIKPFQCFLPVKLAHYRVVNMCTAKYSLGGHMQSGACDSNPWSCAVHSQIHNNKNVHPRAMHPGSPGVGLKQIQIYSLK